MNWTAITRMCCVASMCGTWAVAEGRTPDEVRSILETAVDTEYCGTAMMEGINRFSALQGMRLPRDWDLFDWKRKNGDLSW